MTTGKIMKVSGNLDKLARSELFAAAPQRPDIYWETGSNNFPLTLRTHTLLTWVSEDLFSLSNVYEFLLCFFLFLRILEIVWMPLLCQLPVGFDYLLFLGISGDKEESFISVFIQGVNSFSFFFQWNLGLTIVAQESRLPHCLYYNNHYFWVLSSL